MGKWASIQHEDTHCADGGNHRGARAVRPDTWQVLLGIGLLLTATYVALPYGLLASSLYVLGTASAALAVGIAVLRRPRPFGATAWGLIATALKLAAIGHGIWYWLDLQGLEPFPSAADIFYLSVYPLFAIALWQLGSQTARDDGAFVDALIVGISAAVLGWALLIAPYTYDPDLTWLQLLVSTGYPVADLVLLPLVLRLVFLQRTGITAHSFLLLGMLAYLTADLLYAHGNSTGWYTAGGLTDAFWLIAYSLIMAAAWHPSAKIEPRAHTSHAELSGRRLLVLGAASVLVPMVILFTAGSEMEIIRVAAIASILLFLLVLYRMAGLLRETQHQAKRLENLSRTDPLTGAGNRRHLEEQLTREIARAERTQGPLNLAFLDIDHFKRFNDSHGHAAGDALLQEMVDAWRPILRPTDLLARFGGEEFVVVFPHIDAQQARRVLERLRTAMPNGQTCSAGIASFHPGDTMDSLLGRADQALYAAKDGGRDRIMIAPAEPIPVAGMPAL
ncbi:GGDEF domain-containing protein [Thioalkalivibrio sp. ALMg13-2]|uniref:GGDEF domain-containing protein n=1 Tax=Thioalkalivibrio sp. ALMg13-2 TaxID=1158167 RepID=UPI00036B9D12|nr:GGDEF domain-containing protein [Thioalkalivibrio sp. ALMg13-2]